MKSDPELLQEFVRDRSESAFAELVRRHVDLVYSAAVRQVNGDTHLARDVAQRVFIGLSHQAESLSARTSLVGWLYTSAHHAAVNAVRSERRRRTHEQEAATMQQIDHEENNRADWERLRPVLDEAMLELDEADRDVVLRRFFSGESFAAIGHALELSHEAARKRVERALDRLHGRLARRGIASSASALGLALSHQAVTAAPAGFGAAVIQAAFGTTGGLLTTGSLFVMNKFTVGITAVVVAGLIAFVVEHNSLSRSERELTLKQNELAALKAAVSQEEQALAAHEAKLRELSAASIAETANAAIEQIPPVTPTERVRLDSTYAGMFQRLRLDREKLAALKELLALRLRRTDRELQSILKLRGIDVMEWKWDDLHAVRLIAARDIDEEIGALLGEDGLKYVQNYEYTSRYRSTFSQLLDSVLAPIGEALSPEQTDQLAAWTAVEADQSLSASFPTISQNLVTQATAILTPLQLEKLKLIQANLNARTQLKAANQATALKGKLRLNPGSQREFAEWAAKSAKASNTSAPSP